MDISRIHTNTLHFITAKCSHLDILIFVFQLGVIMFFNHPIIRFTAIKTCCITRQQQSCPTSGFVSGCWHCDHWQSATLQCHLWSCEKKTTKTRRGCYETFQRVNLKQEIWVRAEVSIRDSLARIQTKRIMTWSRILKCPGNQNYIIINMQGKPQYFSTRFLLFQTKVG